MEKNYSCHHAIDNCIILWNQFLLGPLEVVSLNSYHGLDTEWSPPNGNFKNEENDLELNFVAGSWLQEDKENCISLGCVCLAVLLTMCATLWIWSFLYLMVKTRQVTWSSYELATM